MSYPARVRKLIDILTKSSQYLSEKGIQNPRLNAEVLLGHALEMDRVQLYLNYDRPLGLDELTRIKTLLGRREAREPLQYIVGKTEFMSIPFLVNTSVFIPRPETEMLVERVIEVCKLRLFGQRELRILDLGTGSGCIAISIAKYIENARVWAYDISKEALETAARNARLNRVACRITFERRDLLTEEDGYCTDEQFDVMVSNPPYVCPEDFEELPEEVRDHEPTVALRDAVDGMTFYRAISKLAQSCLKRGGLLALEFGIGQAEKIKAIFQTNGFINLEIRDDLNGIARVLLAYR